jgi:hypothetical protein
LASGTFSTTTRPTFTTLGVEVTSASLLDSTVGPYSAVPATNLPTVVRGDCHSCSGFFELSAGDTNRDFVVDVDDMNTPWNNFFTSGGWDEGDLTGDGQVTNDDKAWHSFYGRVRFVAKWFPNKRIPSIRTARFGIRRFELL